MKSLFAAFLLAVSLAFAVSAQQPALIDREIFFGNAEYSGSQISPDGKYISFIKPYNDVRNIWVKGINEPFEKARPITDEKKRPIPNYFWSRDSKYILFTKDNDGDENFNAYAVNPAEAAEGGRIPTARNLTAGKNVRVFVQHVPESDPDAIYVGLNERDPAWHDLYKIKISTGERTLIRENKDRLTGFVFDSKDQLRMASRSTQKGETEMLYLGADGNFKTVYSCNVFESCDAVAFHKDDKRVYMQTNKGEANDLISLTLFDPATGKEEFVESDPNKRVDLGGVFISAKTKNIIATIYNDEKVRYSFKDKDFEKSYNKIKKMLGDREINFGSSTTDENIWIVTSTADVDPGTVWVFNRKSGNLSTLYQVREKLPRASLSQMTPIKYKSSDGLEIPAYLTLPNGLEAKNLPLLVIPHGGPWARSNWGYNTQAQFWSNRGYAVLQPNFRASTGYGKKFLNAGNRQWGELMQDDITWGVNHLIAQGTVDPKRVGIIGVSYGGYATLAGVAYTPDLYSAAVAIVAPSNLMTLLNSIPPYWEAQRTIYYQRMGDPNNPADQPLMKKQSPVFSADKIKTPLIVVQGANDPRVKKAESEQVVVALRDRGYPVEYILAPDEGHGFQRPINVLALYARAENFFAKYLGARAQTEMNEATAKRLKEITVDPKTVTYVGANPIPVNNGRGGDLISLTAGLAGKWKMTVDTGGQQVPVDLEITQSGAEFSGKAVSHLGPSTIEKGKINGNKFTGVLKANVQGQEMDLAMEGEIKSDGSISGTMNGAGLPPLSFTAVRDK